MVQLFHWMAARPLFFMLLWPSLCILIIALGWGTTDNIVEDNVSEQWIPTRGVYAANQRYARSVSGDGGLGATTLAAMAIARDGGNLFTAERLETIRARMERAETIELPCSRLSPMDYFQEARWFFDETSRITWYNDLIQKQLVAPRLPRFGILMGQCASSACSDVVQTRLANNESFLLLVDAGGLDHSDPCRNCIEEGYESLINQWTGYIPSTLGKLAAQTNDETISENLEKLASSITANDVVEFHYYYTARFVYGIIGAPELLNLYSGLAEYVGLCNQYGPLVALTCPPPAITLEAATDIMWSHADADFSSVNSAGLPLPLWDKEDGTGILFKGSSPVGGSGIDMSGSFGSIDAFLSQVASNENMTADPTSAEWAESVENNPFYAWFMADLTLVSENTMCGNGNIPGTALAEDASVQFLASQNVTVPNPFEADGSGTIALQDLAVAIDSLTYELIQNYSQSWCSSYTIPNENTTTPGAYTKQYFGKMWYDLLVVSSGFLDIQEGVDDPYTWTIAEGCGYELRGERGSYTGKSESEILKTASSDLYYIDEGSAFGVVDPGLLIGGTKPTVPPVKESSIENPLKKASVLQTIYPILHPKNIPDRVANCRRPGGPINITRQDAEEILFRWKEAMELAWSEDWEDENIEIQFVAFTDDSGIIGSTGRMLREITLSNTVLTIISIVAIAAFSVFFMFSTDLVESRVVVTLVGVCLVVMSFFAAVGLGLLAGIKIQITIAWTLPFVILGLGVDDIYIVLHALRQQGGYTEKHYMNAMKDVLIPVTMTSFVNASMFAILNVSDIPAVYESARVALFAVIGLYCAVILCFPAYCYVDMKRQAKRNSDLCLFSTTRTPETAEMPSNEDSSTKDLDWRSVLLYDKFYLPLVLGSQKSHSASYIVIWIVTAVLLGASAYGLTQIKVGLGLEEFFPSDNPASVWATTRTQELASWNIGVRWGAIEYDDPKVQMKMIQQFEQIIESDKISPTDTDQLWIGSFLLWSSRLCDSNLIKDDFMVKKCGRDKMFTDGTVCSATWTENTLGLREHFRADPNDPKCYNFAEGICRKPNSMHRMDLEELKIDPILNQDLSYCPVIDSWSDEKWQYCLKEWRKVTGADAGLILKQAKGSPTDCSGEYETDQDVVWPIPISTGPTMYASDLFSHDDTLDLIEETNAVCDNDEEVHCWLTGIPYDYWTQYEDIQYSLLRFGGYSSAIGFLISYCFLFFSFFMDGSHSTKKLVTASFIGALMIFLTIVLSFMVVVGLSLFAGVSLTGFSNMSFVLSVGFSVEFAVHIVSRWMRCDASIISGLDRVRYTMSFLALPTFMSFVSSAIGVCCLAFTAFDFNETYFFRPLIIVMFVTYFFGCWWLPSLLVLIEADVVRLGTNTTTTSNEHPAPKPLEPVKSFDSEQVF